eukprot:TRINITY_DN52810_c0_g1_i1.p1 TRINITY_DN52810_c0_g1~~TRINITY_DN52810_c0_g1_i1.p1  ORF type:complete len:540 (-),score=109.14 TRINITY_DN52810_c0_g1_i1:1043-2641(-)
MAANSECPIKLQDSSPLAQQVQAEIKSKLTADFPTVLSSDDNLLPEYIKVLICNGKAKDAMMEELSTFLDSAEAPGSDKNGTGAFVDWLWDRLTVLGAEQKQQPETVKKEEIKEKEESGKKHRHRERETEPRERGSDNRRRERGDKRDREGRSVAARDNQQNQKPDHQRRNRRDRDGPGGRHHRDRGGAGAGPLPPPPMPVVGGVMQQQPMQQEDPTANFQVPMSQVITNDPSRTIMHGPTLSRAQFEQAKTVANHQHLHHQHRGGGIVVQQQQPQVMVGMPNLQPAPAPQQQIAYTFNGQQIIQQPTHTVIAPQQQQLVATTPQHHVVKAVPAAPSPQPAASQTAFTVTMNGAPPKAEEVDDSFGYEEEVWDDGSGMMMDPSSWANYGFMPQMMLPMMMGGYYGYGGRRGRGSRGRGGFGFPQRGSYRGRSGARGGRGGRGRGRAPPIEDESVAFNKLGLQDKLDSALPDAPNPKKRRGGAAANKTWIRPQYEKQLEEMAAKEKATEVQEEAGLDDEIAGLEEALNQPEGA